MAARLAARRSGTGRGAAGDPGGGQHAAAGGPVPEGGTAPEEESRQVYLKTLTLRGFKSFASATSLRFEPGITCVVGPNGSGKSNVVDAFSWVMGEQGVKPLRGGKMEDVVFAGTAGRPPLGRAEVTLTIDNSDGALPIDYAEVTISRLLFRSGQSEYAINGDQCRLLDVQELLSDTGLGREMHVIVGQGQLDEVLNAGPEARRALIEEAAGVLKHRKRKEKALRKLEAMQANLTRLVDLTGELGRRLKPLGRQAEIARRAAVIQADLRDARLRLLADDYVTLAAELERDASPTRRPRWPAGPRSSRPGPGRGRPRPRSRPPSSSTRRGWPRRRRHSSRLSGLAERLRGVHGLATERHRHLTAPPEPHAARPRPRRARARGGRPARAGGRARRAAGRRAGPARRGGGRADRGRGRPDRDRAAAGRRRQGRRRTGRAAGPAARPGRGRAQPAGRGPGGGRPAGGRPRAGPGPRRAGPAASTASSRTLVSGRDEGRADLAAAHEQARPPRWPRPATGSPAAARPSTRPATPRAALGARTEALEEAVRRGADASGALLAEPGRFAGVLGSVAELLTVEDGAADAIAAALGAAADAVAVSGLDAAVAIIAALKSEDAGQADAGDRRRPAGAGTGGRTRSRARTAPSPARSCAGSRRYARP